MQKQHGTPDISPAIAGDGIEIGYSHAVCYEPFERVVRNLREIDSKLCAERDTVYDYVARRHVVPVARRMYVAPVDATSTVVWLSDNCSEFLSRLSQMGSRPIPYISVYAPMRCWYCVVFERGQVTFEVYDPEQQIRSNTWTGLDLFGQGARRFETIAAFLDFIRPWYRPVDNIWSAERWDNAEFRRELLSRPDCRFLWSVRLQGMEKAILPVGCIPEQVTGWIESMNASQKT